MSIHSEIKRLRLLKKWSQHRLAVEVSKREGLKKDLNYQTVQQWEREPEDAVDGKKSTAPKRGRLAIVAELLGTTPAGLLYADSQPPDDFDALNGNEGRLVALYRLLSTHDQRAAMEWMQQRLRGDEANADAA